MKENLGVFYAEIAVADAMMFAQTTFIQRVRNKHGATNIDMLEKRLAKETQQKCQEGSALSAYYLSKNFPLKFDKIALLVGHGPFTFNSRHLWHTYFLAHDQDKGKWYAGSPANHTANSPESHLVTLHSSHDLNNVLKSIEKKNGGNWLSFNTANEALTNDYIPPKIDQATLTYLSIFTLDKFSGIQKITLVL